MIQKIILAIAVAAVAVSFAPTVSFAKKAKAHAKAKPCTMGTMASGHANNMGWAPVMACGADGKMYPTLMMCYGAERLVPAEHGRRLS